jgi:MinD superfamily P-loop ATPase
LVCPEGAIREVARVTGVVEAGVSGRLAFLQGRLDIGEAMAPPVIRAVLEAAPKDHTLVIDAPPGTSCPVIESIKTADVVLLVTEPTPFGLNDLQLAVEMVRELGLPFGVAINRVGVGDESVAEYCVREGIPVLLELPNDRSVAHAYSRGLLAVEALPEWRSRFRELERRLRELLRRPLQREPVVRLAWSPRSAEVEGVESTEASTPIALGRKSDMRELVLVSGKGGTGKTSIAASFFCLAKEAAVADCDVDAADLHLVLLPEIRTRHPFRGGEKAKILPERCTSCGLCVDHCRFGAIEPAEGGAFRVKPIECEGCGVCTVVCPEDAVEMAAGINGEWYVSDTSWGPMVHARLGVAQENSGKLVSLVRKEAKAQTGRHNRLLICDGSPGIGCPVIASITGAHLVLVVTEPTLSGLHDLERVAALTKQFQIPTGVCINKADINPAVSDALEQRARELGLETFGRVRYDESVTMAQVNRMAVVEAGGVAASDIRALWRRVERVVLGR